MCTFSSLQIHLLSPRFTPIQSAAYMCTKYITYLSKLTPTGLRVYMYDPSILSIIDTVQPRLHVATYSEVYI